MTNDKIEKVMLISPSYTLHKNDVRRCLPPIGLTYLAAALEKEGYQVNILDSATEGYHHLTPEGDRFVTYGLGDEELAKRIGAFNPDVVGVSCIFSTQWENAKKALELAKETKSKVITVVGGSHPTYTLEQTLKNQNVDYAISGEGEIPFLQLLNALKHKEEPSKIGGVSYRKNDQNHLNSDGQFMSVEDLPFPAYHLLDMERYFSINLPQNPYPLGKRVAQVITSRGCSAKCVFCTTTNFWGNRYRGRSAEKVIEEIKWLKERYQIDEIQYTDDNLTLNKRRAMTILDGIKDLDLHWCLPQGVAVWALDEELMEKMKESGCYQLTFAIESGNEHVLKDLIKKPLRLKKVKPLVQKAKELEIKLHGFFICGIPGETLEQMQQTYDFAKDCGFESASFFAATPLVGSELLDICHKGGYLRPGMTPNDQLYKVGNISTPEFKAEEVEQLVEKFNREFNQEDTRTKKFEQEKY